MLAEDFFEIKRNTWSSILYSNGIMKRVSDTSRVICCKTKIRLTGYRSDKIVGPAVESSRVKELLGQIQDQAFKKEDLE